MERKATVCAVEGDFVTVQYEPSENSKEEGEFMDFLKPGLLLNEDDHVIVKEEGGFSQIEKICED